MNCQKNVTENFKLGGTIQLSLIFTDILSMINNFQCQCGFEVGF